MNKILIFLSLLSFSVTLMAKNIDISYHPQRGVFSTRPAKIGKNRLLPATASWEQW